MSRIAPEAPSDAPARAELRAMWQPLRGGMRATFLFSAVVNLLLLSAPLYMMQVYDRVLPSRSVETLVVLTGLLAGLYLVMGVLDHARSRIMARVGARLQAGLEARVLRACQLRLAQDPGDAAALAGERDLDSLARLQASPAVLALCDLPWTPVFFAALVLFHPWLGGFALAGASILALASWANQRTAEQPLQAATSANRAADRASLTIRQNGEVIRALGMGNATLEQWVGRREAGRAAGLAASDAIGGWTVTIRTFRLFLQSAMLGLAAFLVLRDQLSAGAMIAASILMGRALQPIEQVVAHWPALAQARQAKTRLLGLLAAVPAGAPRLDLPRPAARLVVQGLTVLAAGGGAPILKGVSFALQPGQVMGVIGPSAAGKSTLARALIQALPVEAGQIRLDGATLDQFDPDRLGRWIGYLPQRVVLFEGTVAQNIARLDPGADPDAVIAAARAADAHEMILRLPEGYDTRILPGTAPFSGGQLQRIGLARALYGDPVLVILDEPNANLDSEGGEALNRALRVVKSIGSVALIMAHRPAALQECDLLLVLKEGSVTAFGPRDEVLRDAVQNAAGVGRRLQQGRSA